MKKKRTKLQNTNKSERLGLLKKMLIQALGGKCVHCGRVRRLEINHIDGTTWVQRQLNSYDRWMRYVKEYREGIRLNILCRKCNAGWRPGNDTI